jgi:hypothetical protein
MRKTSLMHINNYYYYYCYCYLVEIVEAGFFELIIIYTMLSDVLASI